LYVFVVPKYTERFFCFV